MNYDKVEIYFSGYSLEYLTSEEIVISNVDSNKVEKLNELKTFRNPIWFGNKKGTDYTIDLVYINSYSGEKLLVRILKSVNSEPTIIYGTGTIFDSSYRNDSLVEYVNSIIGLETIEQYNGSLNQEEYDNLF
ncbi:MAG: hypothetical protein JJ971_13500 [Balneolaceae bacterium]|nr:hypothetical protein [Balneolaceae bacterium]MBO6547129.1 hypothetical protein [Balneolaceae bacterium]